MNHATKARLGVGINRAPATIQTLAVTEGLGVAGLPDRLPTFSIPPAV